VSNEQELQLYSTNGGTVHFILRHACLSCACAAYHGYDCASTNCNGEEIFVSRPKTGSEWTTEFEGPAERLRTGGHAKEPSPAISYDI
jgi:hypothetical protein